MAGSARWRLPRLTAPTSTPACLACRLLATVPAEDMQKARDVVDAISRLDEEAATEEAAVDASQLSKLL